MRNLQYFTSSACCSAFRESTFCQQLGKSWIKSTEEVTFNHWGAAFSPWSIVSTKSCIMESWLGAIWTPTGTRGKARRFEPRVQEILLTSGIVTYQMDLSSDVESVQPMSIQKWILIPGSVQGQGLEQLGIVKIVPAHGRGWKMSFYGCFQSKPL